MRRYRLPLAISPLLAVSLIACQPGAPETVDTHATPVAQVVAHETADAHGAHGSAQDHHTHPTSVPAPAEPWPSDAPLRAGMDGIAQAYRNAREAQAAGTFNADSAAILNGTVQERTAYMFANCELEPDADAALHVLLARLGEGAAKTNDAQTVGAGLDAMGEALQHYPHYFAHAGWESLK